MRYSSSQGVQFIFFLTDAGKTFMLFKKTDTVQLFYHLINFNIVLCCYMQHVIIDNIVEGYMRYYFERFGFVTLYM